MDLDKLRQCEDEDDFSDLMMEDILGGYNDPAVYPNHKQIAVVDHAKNFDLSQRKLFFETVHKDLRFSHRKKALRGKMQCLTDSQ